MTVNVIQPLHSFELNPKLFKEMITAATATIKGAQPGSIWAGVSILISGDWICFVSSNGISRMCSVAGQGVNVGNTAGEVLVSLPVFHVWDHVVEDNEPISIQFNSEFVQIGQYRWSHVYRRSMDTYPIKPQTFKLDTNPTLVVSQEQLAWQLYAQQTFAQPEGAVVSFSVDPMKKQIFTNLENGFSLSLLEYYGQPAPVTFALNLLDLPILNAIPEEKLYLGLCDPAGQRILISNEQKTFKFLLKGAL